MKNFVVALDGPAGSGKSSISNLVAKKLGFTHIDTGAMYRAVTVEALRRKINIENEAEYSFLKEVSILYKDNIIYLNGEDVSVEIRSAEVTKNVSTCCKFATVRNLMVEYQRASAKYGNVLMDGRDIGTVVLPDADLKIFLTASPEVRAQRRHEELTAKGIQMTYEEVLEDINLRDYKDSHRTIAPLKMASDAILVDTSNLSIDEVTKKIIQLINERKRSMEENFKMEDLDLPKRPRVKDKVTGTVVKVEDKTIYLDIKSITEGIMHLDHYTTDATVSSFKGLVKEGDVIECEVAKVSETKDGETNIYLSRLHQLSKIAFHEVVLAYENKEDIEVVVVKNVPNKGYMVQFLENQLFMPLSQAPQNVKMKDTLKVRILEVNEDRKNAVVSYKVIEKEEYEAARQQELDSINAGDVLTGKVVKVEKFGAFIRFNHVQGLLRINQLAHTFTNDIHSVIHEGEDIEVKIISKENNKLVLSRKALLDTPYTAYAKSVTVGQTVKGTVSNKLPFGLLLELAPNVKGLLHQSEYSHNPNDNYNAYVVIGD
ncbi:MAG: (d)CMP kinase, partial [Anaeroplasmataceae bacterium]|nr:(d)CMP kinase [Anaeroplasmataceae bacterium]